MQPCDEDVLLDLASACDQAVTILLRRYDHVQYSAVISNIARSLWMGEGVFGAADSR